MKIKLKFILLLIIIFLVSISTVSAETNDNQTNCIFTIDDATTETIETFDELQDAINQAGEGATITLEKDYIFGQNSKINGMGIDKTITIDGKGHTLDGQNCGRIFYISDTANNVLIKNTIFTNGYHREGAGAITVRGAFFTLDNCTFINNNANGAISGAIYVVANDAKVTNCKFYNNTIENSGGAFRIEGDNQIISNNIFINNKATKQIGGAICVYGDNILITDNYFENNTAGRDGGAVELEGVGIAKGKGSIIKNNIFVNNKGVYGGALGLNIENCTILNNKFINNQATEYGGAIRIVGSSTITATITKNTFTDNYAIKDGGAIYSFGNKTNVKNNTFTNNKVTSGAGGAIWISGNEISIIENDFTNNNANREGGAIYYSLGYKNTAEKNSFLNNSATYGGAVSIIGNSLSVTENTFSANHATGYGGALKITENNSKVSKNIFKNNYAEQRGGAIYSNGNNINIFENTFENNKATTSIGGTLYNLGDNTQITSNTIKKSYSKSNGGTIYLDGKNAKIKFNNISGSISDENGGAAFIRSESATLSNNNFTSNKAGSSNGGGAIRIIGDNIVINENIFNENSAKLGSTIYGTGEGGKITKNKFIDNKENDGSLRWEGTKTLSGNKYGSDSGSVIKTILISSDKSYGFTATKTLTATLKDSNGNAITNKEIKFNVNGKTYLGKTNANGIATVKVSLSAIKKYPVTIKYLGDDKYQPTTKIVNVNVIKEKTKLTSPKATFKKSLQNKKVTITLKTTGGKTIAKKKITLTVNGKTYKATTNSKGQAAITVKLTVKKTYSYTVKFAGDSQHVKTTATGKIIIK